MHLALYQVRGRRERQELYQQSEHYGRVANSVAVTPELHGQRRLTGVEVGEWDA
jgi:hypothetical protein